MNRNISFYFYRILWIVVIALSFIFCNILIAHFWLRYKSNTIKSTIESNHVPLPNLPLPAITLCPLTEINPHRLAEISRELYLSTKNNYDILRLRLILKIESIRNLPATLGHDMLTLILRDIMVINLPDKFQGNISRIENMKDFQNYCNQILIKCRFQETIYPCAEIIAASVTHHGVCCTFNANHQFKWAKKVISYEIE